MHPTFMTGIAKPAFTPAGFSTALSQRIYP